MKILVILSVVVISLGVYFSFLEVGPRVASGSAEVDVEEVEGMMDLGEVGVTKDLHLLASKGHHPLSYRALWDALGKIDMVGGDVRLIYSRKLRSKDKHGGGKGDWNREHVWPRSYGIGKSGADYTDLHAIFPCDVSLNSSRGNKFFDNETDRDSWLPVSEVRGDIARAMFYMAVRYDGGDPNTVDLKLSNTPDTQKGELGMLSTLIDWHKSDPIDTRERARNESVYLIQGNRNPFIDDPELVKMLDSGS